MKKPLIIGIGHKMRVGKDTLAAIMDTSLRFRKVSAEIIRFADPIKDSLAGLLEIPWERMHSEIMKCATVDGTPFGLSKASTLREIMQTYGVAMRERFPGIWIKLLVSRAESSGVDVVLVPDMRFPDELGAIKALGGVTIDVTRDIDRSGPEHQHISETALDGYTFDHVIQNNGSLQDLGDECERSLRKILR